ncbi:Uncharacterised protein [Legionella wadsworthii]|uniref:Uncharacterized protein n=1 Tax=Legionella wadsworthii TaxID=28088 RepID=A0A378LPF5_9GAMM|nr:hypothetical protein [Legionella wadsworthii]STY28644.1 Uncharacterised protein [Legionella wadsworthii]
MLKKLLLCGVMGAATLFSTATAFAYYYDHDYPRYKFYHHRHHQPRWKNFYRWTPPPGDQIIVENGPAYPRYHQHY